MSFDSILEISLSQPTFTYPLLRAKDVNPQIMLSRRGQSYAHSGLMTGYLRDRKDVYSKDQNPHGEISFANAENVSMVTPDDPSTNTNSNSLPCMMKFSISSIRM